MTRCSLVPLVVLWLGSAPVGPAAVADDSKPKPKPDEGPAQVELQVLTDASFAALAIEAGSFSEWGRPVIAALQKAFHDETMRRDVVVQVTLRPQGPPEVAAAGRPALSADECKAVRAAVDGDSAPHSRVIPFSFRFVAKINGGHPAPDLALSPPLETPDEARLGRFQKADTAGRLALLRAWATGEALPLLAASARGADPKFAGVRKFGATLAAVAADANAPVDVAALTDRNPDYWRATIEMAPGLPLVPAAHVALHVANGEIDKARRIADVINAFDRRQSGPSRLLADFRALMLVFYQDVEARIQKGIAAHDAKRFDEALGHYDALLKDYPRSAWARYERFQTLRAQGLAAGKPVARAADWPATAREIDCCDPLYPFAAQAQGDVAVYRLFRRQSYHELFKDPAKLSEDIVKYADIALDLDQNGFAALLYWNVVTAFEPKVYGDRPLVEYFLYGLERLGVPALKENFKGDHAAEFAKIVAERRRLMEDSPHVRRPPGAEKPNEVVKRP